MFNTHIFIGNKELKRCSTCRNCFSFEKFNKNKYNKDGLHYECKFCVQRNHERYHKGEKDFIEEEIISIEELRIKVKHQKELDELEKYIDIDSINGYNNWYWDSLMGETDD